MNGKIKALIVVVGLIVVFCSGWLVAQAQNVYKVSPVTIWANQWTDSVSLLARNGHSTELTRPEKIPLIVGFGLNSQSLVLGQVYDNLPPAIKQQLMFYIPAARAIAAAQQGPGPMQDRRDLLTFVDCMQKVQSQGGSVHGCVETHKR